MKAKLCLVLAILAACATLANSSTRAQETSSETSPGTRPNIVFVLTDDQDEVSLRHMPNLQRFLVDGGKTFENAVNVYPLCCPSRAAIQRGQYSHNTGVFGNGRETAAAGTPSTATACTARPWGHGPTAPATRRVTSASS